MSLNTIKHHSSLAVLLLVATLASLYLLNISMPQEKGPLRLHTDEACDLARHNCSASASGRELTVTLSPRPVPVLDKVEIEVHSRGVDSRSLQLRITGVEQDMGLIETRLRRERDGLYRGHFYLSVCSRTLMTWKMVVTSGEEEGGIIAVFHFQTRAQRPVEILG